MHEVESNKTFLVDPAETVPTDTISTSEYVVFRKTEVVRKQAFREQSYNIGEIQTAMGLGDITIDSANMTSWIGDNQVWLVASVALFFAVFSSVADYIANPIYSLVACVIVGVALRGRGATFAGTFGTAMLLSLLTSILAWALWGFGFPLGWFGLLLWPTFLTIGTGAVATIQLRAAE